MRATKLRFAVCVVALMAPDAVMRCPWVARLEATGLAPGSRMRQTTSDQAPTLQFREASGCGGLVLYAWNDERTEVLLIRIDQSRVKLPDGSTDFELPSSAGVTIQLEVTETPRDDFPYCSSEKRSAGAVPALWTAVSGKLKVMVRRRPKATFSPISVEIDRLVVRGPTGVELKQRREIRFTAAIGDEVK